MRGPGGSPINRAAPAARTARSRPATLTGLPGSPKTSAAVLHSGRVAGPDAKQHRLARLHRHLVKQRLDAQFREHARHQIELARRHAARQEQHVAPASPAAIISRKMRRAHRGRCRATSARPGRARPAPRSIGPLLLRICPGPGFTSAVTSSSPVESIATTRRRLHHDRRSRPTAASKPNS